MDIFRIAVSCTVLYFLWAVVFEKCSHFLASRAAGSIRFTSEKNILISSCVYYVSKVCIFFIMSLILAAAVLKFSPYQDFSQTIGLTKPARKGKVILTSKDNKTISKIVITDPHVYVQPAPFQNVASISFRFQIIKGNQEKELILTGGKLVVRSFLGNQVLDTSEIPLSDEFKISNPDLTGAYVSPKPVVLKPGVDAIELVWEMKLKNGDTLSSKPNRLVPEEIRK